MNTLSKLTLIASLSIPSLATADKLSAAARLELVPFGDIHIEAGGDSSDESMAFGYGFAGEISYEVAPQITVGFAPRYLLSVNTKEAADADADAASQLDLAAKVAYNHQVNDQVSAYGYLAPGFSIIMPPSSAPDEAENATGFVVGFGGGGRYQVNPQVFVTAELGYNLGFQGNTVDLLGQSIDVTTAPRFVHLGLGAGANF